jgi:tetratricopeptide (TPR) repeat protein
MSYKKIAVIFVALFLFIVSACDRKGENIPTFPPTADSRLSEGWSNFEAGNYSIAIERFAAAKNRDASYADAYRGLGWSYSRVMDFTNAESNFKIYATLFKDDPAKLNDVNAGLATMFGAAGNDSKAIELSELVIAADANYSFDHDPRVNTSSLRALIARSYYNQGNYLATLEFILNNLDAAFLSSLIGDGTLQEKNNDVVKIKIPAISPTPLTGQTGMALMRQVIVNSDTSIVGVHLVKVLDIRSFDGNAHYSIVSFTQGDNRITFVGNPVPKNNDQFLVDYLFAPDYGIFLSKLLQKIDVLG